MVNCIDCKNRDFNTHNQKFIICLIDQEYRAALRWRTCIHDAFEHLPKHIAEMDRLEVNAL